MAYFLGGFRRLLNAAQFCLFYRILSDCLRLLPRHCMSEWFVSTWSRPHTHFVHCVQIEFGHLRSQFVMTYSTGHILLPVDNWKSQFVTSIFVNFPEYSSGFNLPTRHPTSAAFFIPLFTPSHVS